MRGSLMARLAGIALLVTVLGLPCMAQDGLPQTRSWAMGEIVDLTIAAATSIQELTSSAGVTLRFDAGTLGAFLLADFKADLSTQPLGLTLPMGDPKPMIVPAYLPDKEQLHILLGSGGSTLVSIDLPLTGISRFLLRQRDQIGLYALAPGQQPVLVWLGAFTYRITLPKSDEYTLCQNLKLTMGDKELAADSLINGLHLDHLDAVADLVVTGTDPQGNRFEHRYELPYQVLAKRVGEALSNYLSTIQQAQSQGQ